MQDQRVKITKALVTGARPRDAEYTLWDSVIPGLGLRVRPSGAKSFVFTYRSAGGRKGKVHRVTIKAATPDQARRQAAALAAAHHAGGDPAGERAERRRAASVADVLDAFLRDHVRQRLKPKTALEYGKVVERVLKPYLGAITVAELQPKHVAAMYLAMQATPTYAGAAVRVLRSAMSHAEEWGFRPPGTNPARIRIKAARRRERLFSDAEVARLHAATDALEKADRITPAAALAIRLLFATGCRAGEIMSLTWDGVDAEAGFLRWRDSKTGALSKPLTPEGRRLLEQADRIVGVAFVCPSPSFKQMRLEQLAGSFERVMRHADVKANETASTHLVRHWFASKTYSDASIPLPVQMAIVGHKSVATAMRYAHVAGAEVKKAADDAARRRGSAVRAAGARGSVVALPVGKPR